MKFAIVGKFTQADSQAEVNCCPDAFEGGFDVDSFWEYLFADPSYRFVCSASSPSTSFSAHFLLLRRSSWAYFTLSSIFLRGGNLHHPQVQVEDKPAEPVAFSSGPFNLLPHLKSLPERGSEGRTHYSAVLCCHHQVVHATDYLRHLVSFSSSFTVAVKAHENAQRH
jgi:hypothetical protein